MRVRLAIVPAALAIGTLIASTSPAYAASGGGCGNVAGGQIKACVSESGVYVLGDAYVTGSSGTVYIIIYDYTDGHTVASGSFGGGSGHKGPIRANAIRGHDYQTQASTGSSFATSPDLLA